MHSQGMKGATQVDRDDEPMVSVGRFAPLDRFCSALSLHL